MAPSGMVTVDNTTPGLERAWYAVALSTDVGDTPHPVQVLGAPWVLYRGGGRVRAFADRCPHRLAPLSIGTTAGDRLRCRYHGWEFGNDGGLLRIPALGDDATLPAVCLDRPAGVEERYGLVWLAPEQPVCDLPEFPEWGAPGFDLTWNEPRTTSAGAAQLCDNFLDAAHLPTVHTGTFGVADAAYLPPQDVARHDWTASTTYRVTYRNGDDPKVATGEHPLEQPQDLEKAVWPATTAVVRLYFPLTDRTMSILFSCLPVDATTTIVFKMMARNDLEGDASRLSDAVDFEDRVLDEDLAVLESYRSSELPVDLRIETHTRVDRLSATYRRILADLVAAPRS